MFGRGAYQALYKNDRKKYKTQDQIPKGVIDPLIIQDLDDDELIEDPMFWHLIDVWRWLIKFDGALSRCSTLTRREQDLCKNFEKKRITNPYASIYASKFITYLLVNKWMIVGSDKPEVMIGLIQVLILIVSNFAFDDTSYQKLAEIGIPIKGFPILATFAVIKQADPGYGYFLQELRKKKIEDTKFNFVKATNSIFQTILKGWQTKVENMKMRGEKTVERDDKEEATLAYGDGVPLIDVQSQFVSVIGTQLRNPNYFPGSDIADLIKNKPGIATQVSGSNDWEIDFNRQDLAAAFYYSSFFTAYLTQFLQGVVGNNYVSLERAQLVAKNAKSPPDVSDYPQIDFSDILNVALGLKITISPGAPAGLSTFNLNVTAAGITDGTTPYYISHYEVSANSAVVYKDGGLVAGAVVAPGAQSYIATYAWNNKMDLFSKTLLTQFEPSAIKQIVDLSNDKAFALLLALFSQSGTKPKGIDQLKKTVKTYKEMMTLEDDSEYDYKKLKRKAGEEWGAPKGYYKKSGGRRKSRSGGRGRRGSKKRSYGRRH